MSQCAVVIPPPPPHTEKAGQKVQELRAQLNQRQQDTESKYGTVVAVAKRHLSRALVEERTWYCSFTDMFGKVMVRWREGLAGGRGRSTCCGLLACSGLRSPCSL